MSTNSKGFAQIVLIIAVLILVGGAVYYFGIINKKANLTSKILTPTLAPYPTFSGKPTNPSTANWKTYTNHDWKFLIKYPNTYSVQMAEDGGMQYLNLSKSGDYLPGTDAFSHFKISIKNRTERNVDETIRADQDRVKVSSQITETKLIDIAGTQGKSFYASGYGHTQLIYVFNNESNKVMSIFVNTPSEDVQKQEQADVDQVLSTFKFTK